MTILIKKNITLTEDAQVFIQKYINYIGEVNPADIYEGLTDKQILKNKFIFKISQLNNLDLANIDLHITNNTVYILASVWNSKVIKIGTVALTNQLKLALSHGYYPSLQISGGNCKKVITTEYGEDTISNDFVPHQLKLVVHQADTKQYHSQKIDSIYQSTFKNENSLISLAKNLMRCFAVFGLLLGIGFMFLGFFLTGLMVVVAFFGVNSYTLLLADTHMQQQSQRAN